MIDHVAQWSGGVSATLTLTASLVGLAAFAVARWCSWRIGRGGLPPAAALTHSGWRMETRRVLEQWEDADRRRADDRLKAPDRARAQVHVVHSALCSYWTDLVASIALGFTLFVAASTVGVEEGVMRIHDLRDPAAYAAIGATVAAIVIDLTLLLVIREYRGKGSVNWLYVSLAMVGTPFRVLLGAAAVVYILVAAAAT